MKVSQIITEFRTFADDAVEPYAWSDEQVMVWLDEAQQQAAERASLIITHEAQLLRRTITAGTALYEFDTPVIEVQRVWLPDSLVLLQQTDIHVLDAVNTQWQAATGTPSHYMFDYQSRTITFYPTPVLTEVPVIKAARLPEDSLNQTTDTPEIPERYHLLLAHWAVYRAMSIASEDTFNPTQADWHRSRFEEQFGPARSGLNHMIKEQYRGFIPRTIYAGGEIREYAPF